MENLITEVGLILKNDAGRSPTENLFRQLFGRWPNDEVSSDEGMDNLEGIINDIDGGEVLYTFFGLFDRESALKDIDCTHDILKQVNQVLRVMRAKYTVDILCVYGENENIDVYSIVKENRMLKAENERLTKQPTNQNQTDTVLDSRVDVLDLDKPIEQALYMVNIQSIRDLINRTAYEIHELEGMTDAGFVSIVAELSTLNLHLLPPTK